MRASIASNGCDTTVDAVRKCFTHRLTSIRRFTNLTSNKIVTRMIDTVLIRSRTETQDNFNRFAYMSPTAAGHFVTVSHEEYTNSRCWFAGTGTGQCTISVKLDVSSLVGLSMSRRENLSQDIDTRDA